MSRSERTFAASDAAHAPGRTRSCAAGVLDAVAGEPDDENEEGPLGRRKIQEKRFFMPLS